ncbi:MAG: hypothetical protein Q8K24_08950 [Hydrogenophaga sp.]|nr:hypothetical protein [Hydrogenophaga sp.]
MADVADLAEEHIEREAPYLLAACHRPVPRVAAGQCLYCDAEAPGLRFCDADCRADWERLQERQRVNGWQS